MEKVRLDWRVSDGIASVANFCVLLAVLFSFPLVLRWTGALGVAQIAPQSPLHTRAFLKACFVLTWRRCGNGKLSGQSLARILRA